VKDRVLNVLMLSAVAAARVFSLLKGAPETERVSPSLLRPAVREEASDPLTGYRRYREETRIREKSALTALIENGENEENKALAESMLLSMAKNSETELAVEAAMTARGYPDSLCAARENEIVLLLAAPVSERDAALFLEIAMAASGLPIENIRIAGCSI
jgi:hypothetical protein